MDHIAYEIQKSGVYINIEDWDYADGSVNSSNRDECENLSGPDVGCDGVCFSDAVEDECGICGGDGIADDE